MKKTIVTIFAFTITALFLSSCENESIKNIKSGSIVNLENKLINLEDFNTITNKIYLNNNKTHRFNNDEAITEIQATMQPLVDNGDLLYNEIKKYDYNNELPDLDDTQLAELSFALNIIIQHSQGDQYETYGNILGISDHAYDCLGAAIGIGAIKSLVSSTASLAGFSTASAATMSSAELIGLVKVIGGRTAGWIGVAIMVGSFIDCYNGF